LITDLSKAYELLGVKPGVSSRELKAAHRDLAKVWHPDRFVHDPRLQEKAQEKLKEINEAYELLSSGKTPRPAPAPPPKPVETIYYTVSDVSRPAPRGGNGKWAVVTVLLFLAVFGVTTKVLLDRRSHSVPQVADEQTAPVEVEAARRTESGSRGEVGHKTTRDESVPVDNSSSTETSPSAPTPAIATVTVLIDPESGLRAKPDCPVRSRMTYPSGSEPTAYCNINHAPPPKESKLKSIREKILH
jgi:DnaJ-like protein